MRFLHVASGQWWQYTGDHNYALGTSLCYRREWWAKHPFPAKQIGEDNQFVMDARAAGQIVSVDAGDLMWATTHSGNTSPRNLKRDSWKQIAA